uniref:Uncharacterized protein LOC100180777 n=1 Tax=Phallusia mammillata TaxID=59560 RepID=A0A6F9DGM7_9ASCI|nr:uncharacterized protein LOC100180777 [Phallusia mammillata]
MGRHSSSDSERRESKKKKKKRSRKRSRSRSPSYSHRSSKSSSSRRRNSRSRSRSSDRSRGESPSRKKRSRSSDKYRRSDRSSRRSRSRSSSRDRHSTRKRSRSRSKDRSSRTKKRASRDRSRSPVVRRKKHVDAVLGVRTGTLKDVMDIVPGFSKMTPAEQSKIRIQKALNAAVESSAKDEEAIEEEQRLKKEDVVDTREQIDRLKAIEAIADSDDEADESGFMPTHFKSSVKLKKKLALAESNRKADATKTSFMERESTHELAIFGHSSMISMDEAVQRKKKADDEALLKAKRRIEFSRRDPETLVGDALLASSEELQQRWQDKLRRLREKFLENPRGAV